MKKKHILFLFYFIIICSSAFSQNQIKIDSLKNTLKHSSDNFQKVKLLNELCWIQRNTNTDSALFYGTRALELADSIGDIENKIKALSFTGVVYRNKGIYAKALELYYEGEKLAKQTNNYEQLTYAYINIGNIYIYLDEFNQAFKFLEKALEISKNNNNTLQQGYIYYNISLVYTKLGNYSKARYFNDKVIEMRAKNHEENGLLIAKKNLGDILLKENKPKEALQEYEKTLKLSKRLNINKTIIANLENEIAKIYASQKKFNKASRYAKESLKISQKTGDKFRAKESNLTLANIYSSQGLFKKAYSYYVAYSQLNDSLFSAESNRQINAIQTIYKINKKDEENKLLKIGKLHNLATIRQQRIIGWLIAGISLILTVLVFILLRTLKQKKLSNKLLIKKNHEINKLSIAIEQSPSTIVITDLKGNIEYANPYFEKLTGYSTKEVIGLNPRILQSGETPQNTYINLWETVTSGKTWTGEFINKKKNNEKYIEKSIISPIENDQGEIVNYIAIKENITKQKEIEQELKTAKEQAEELNATKDKFFSIIAHDLKNPFNAIIGFLDLLLSSHKNISEEKRELYIQSIYKSAKNAFTLLENLLLWARSQRGTMQFNPELISLKTLFQDIVDLHKETAIKKEISLNYLLTDDIMIKVDENMLTSVLNNLITNALKFTNIKGKVNLSAILTENNVKITIEDNGVGMDEETKNKLFRLSTNQSTEGTAGEMGTGLGLILCKEFVEKSSGKIWVESELEKGSRFIFTLPAE